MSHHEILNAAGSLLALALFVPLVVNVVRTGGAGQSFAMWLLWAAMDAILTVSLFQQKGNYLLFVGFVIGGVSMTVALLWQGRNYWGKFETVVALLVLACVVVWKISGPQMATIATTAGVCVAGLPGFAVAWKHPDRTLGLIWLGNVLANALAFFGGTAMTVEQRLAPGVFTVFSALMFLAFWLSGKRTEDAP